MPRLGARGLRSKAASERGAVAILFTLLIVALVGVTAIAVDLTTFSQEKQELYNTTDAAALAGVSQLPEDYLGAAAMARDFAIRNNPDLVGAALEISYRCVVGDRNGDGQPDPEDVPAACDPGPDTPITAPPFVCDLDLCYAPCFPADGDICNTIVVGGSETVDFSFAGVIGVSDTDTSVASAACVGFCGDAPTGPLDVVLVLDRTDSMSSQDLNKAQVAARDMLRFLNPSVHDVALATLLPGDPDDPCHPVLPQGDSDNFEWLVVPLSNDYQDDDGELNGTSDLVRTITCLDQIDQRTYQTDLGSPINDAEYGRPDSLSELIGGGRAEAKKGIILLSDGQANQPNRQTACRYAAQMAQVAKDAEVEIFTIGFGIESGAERCHEDDPRYPGARATLLLADMASGGADDNCRERRTEEENTDGDNFFCEPKSGDLSEIFIAAAAQLASDAAKLVYLPDDA